MITISRACDSDIDVLHALDRLLSPVYSSAESYRRVAAGGLLLVARLGADSGRRGAVAIGFAAFSFVLDEATLLNLVVREDSRRQGVAKALLDEAWKQLPSQGVQRVLLELRESNSVARACYEREGFTLDGERLRYYPRDDGTRETALLMSLNLAVHYASA